MNNYILFKLIYIVWIIKNFQFSFVVSDKSLREVHRLVRRELKVINNIKITNKTENKI